MNKVIVSVEFTMSVMVMNNSNGLEALITHKQNDVSFDISVYREALEKKENLSLPIEEEILLLEQLAHFELGRFLLMHKGLNGYWTAYIIRQGLQQKNLHPLETWFLHRAPAVKATQERFKIFQKVLQDNLKDHVTIASIPCGLMDDLLLLDFTKTHNIRLVGIDLDADSLAHVAERCTMMSPADVDLIHCDAWSLDNMNEFDIITSNGLNIYEPDDEKVIALYKKFYQALKPEGLLITSFLTPPPALSSDSSWKHVIAEDALKQKAIFSDIIGVTWQAFRTEKQMREHLSKAGFYVIQVLYDSHGVFPTIVAKKI